MRKLSYHFCHCHTSSRILRTSALRVISDGLFHSYGYWWTWRVTLSVVRLITTSFKTELKGKGKGGCLHSRHPRRFSGLYINYCQLLELTLSQSHLPGENTTQFSAAVAIRIVPIVVPSGTHYCWVDRRNVDSELAQAFTHGQSCGNRTRDPLISSPTP